MSSNATYSALAKLVVAALLASSNFALAESDAVPSLAQFNFKDGKAAAAWGQEVIALKKRFQSGDESSRRAVADLFAQWHDHFENVLKDDGLSLSESRMMDAFVENLWMVAETNVRNYNSKKPWWQSINRFAHLTFDDFKEHFLQREFTIPDNVPDIDIKPLKWAECVDWNALGKVTPVKNQGACGSCWAFSAIAATESNYLIEKGKTFADEAIDLSEQQVVDCVNAGLTDTNGDAYDSQGCSGGRSPEAFDFIHKYGVYSENANPYTATDTNTCRKDYLLRKEMKGTGTSPGWGRLSPSSNTNAIKTALNKQTLSHYLRVEQPFQLYNGGVFTEECEGSGVNHATLLYGYCDYTFDNVSTDVWKIKNSWGTGWGENGMMKMKMTEGDGICQSQEKVWVDDTADWRFAGKINPSLVRSRKAMNSQNVMESDVAGISVNMPDRTGTRPVSNMGWNIEEN